MLRCEREIVLLLGNLDQTTMNKKPLCWFSISCAALCAAIPGAKAEGDISDNFQHDKYELTLASGVMFSPIGADHDRSTVNYTLSALQFGWMLSDVKGPGILRGNWELAGEAMGGTVFKGEGSYMVGGTLWFRYNFVQPVSLLKSIRTLGFIG